MPTLIIENPTPSLRSPSTKGLADAAPQGVRGGPRLLLRVEGALALFAALAAYHHLGGGWGWLAALFLVPDLVLLGYLAGPRFGAALYNTGHSYIGPALLAGVGLASNAPVWVLGALIWVAHVGFDRMLGYGLKHATGFRDTHLGRVGRDARTPRR